MLELIDIKKSLLAEMSLRKKHLYFFCFISASILFLVSFLMIKSNDDYLLNLIATIILSILYLFYLIFYFTIIRSSLTKKISFLNNALKSELTTYRGEIISIEFDSTIFNDLDFYVGNVKVIGNIKDEIKTFYFPKQFNYHKNRQIRLNTFGKIVVSIEGQV